MTITEPDVWDWTDYESRNLRAARDHGGPAWRTGPITLAGGRGGRPRRHAVERLSSSHHGEDGRLLQYVLWICGERATPRYAITRSHAELAKVCGATLTFPTGAATVVIAGDSIDLLGAGRELNVPSARVWADAAELRFRRGTVLVGASVPVRELDGARA